MENPELEETKEFMHKLNNVSGPFLEKAFFRDKFRNKLVSPIGSLCLSH
jgi:hypothetical protein